jgi:DNA-binding phage protein
MITERIQEAIRSGGMSRYALSHRTGVDQALLCRFLKGQSSMSFETADKVLDALGLEVVIRPRHSTKKGGE